MVLPEKTIASLSPIERKMLPLLEDGLAVEELAKRAKAPSVEAMRAVQFLQNKGLVQLHEIVQTRRELTELGRELQRKGLPEKKLYDAIKTTVTLKELAGLTGLEKNQIGGAIGRLKDAGLIVLDKGTVTRTEKKPLFETEKFLNDVHGIKDKEFEKLQRLGLAAEKKSAQYEVNLTPEGRKIQESLSQNDTTYLERLTSDMLKDGTWKNAEFRHYDVTTPVPKTHYGRAHFVQQAIDAIKQLWIEMGFSEMSGTMAQTAFWDLDALFVPQDHPAREMQDTFYLTKQGELPEWWEEVKVVHENGGDTGSSGWQYQYSKEEAKKVLLRTHTTVLSAQTLRWMKEQGLTKGKFFSVHKVFRNETLDWKHLFEFHQVEGIVVGENLSLGDLIGLQKEFYKKMGFTDIRFRPGYFPYTEPSAEVEVYHPQKQQWLELGGMGVFRPEVVKTLLGVDVPVLAWGLGMERIITDHYDINDLRELYRNDLSQLRNMKEYVPPEAQ
jgi:phenylalanyl-tRNA synthetase alpha chain